MLISYLQWLLFSITRQIYIWKNIFSKLIQHPFSFILKLFYYYECKLRNIYKSTWAFTFLWWNQKEPLELFDKKAVLKNFEIFTGKRLCWSLLLPNLQAFRPDSRRDSDTSVFMWILRNIEKHLFWRTFANVCFR